jgi:hypothetical protein
VVYEGPRMITIYCMFVLSDYFFVFIYVLFNEYIYPSGLFGFTVVPKIFVAASFCIYFDDNVSFIVYVAVISAILSYF